MLIPYNKVDCEILWKAVAEFEKEVVSLGGQLQQTIASTAMNLFRRSYLKQTIHTSEVANQIALKGYFASQGRGLRAVTWTTSHLRHQLVFPLLDDVPPAGEPHRHAHGHPDGGLGHLPLRGGRDDRDPRDGRAAPPVPDAGRQPRLLPDRALALVVHLYGHQARPPRGRDPAQGPRVLRVRAVLRLRHYAREIYALRSASKTPFRKLLLKYLLNSLYGKAAESLLKQEMLINPEEKDLIREKLQMLQPGVWLKEKEVPIAHRHVIVSAIITALSRRHLYDYMKMCLSQNHKPYYSDSITGDRTVVLQAPDGRIVIDPVSEVWDTVGQNKCSYKGEKETCEIAGWKALAKDKDGNEGWFPVKKLIRHKTVKGLHLVSSKRGQVHVTEDHSLVVDNEEIKPADFVARNLQFETVKAPAPVVVDKVDLYDYVKDFKRTAKGSVYHGGSVDSYFEPDLTGQWLNFVNYRGSTMSVKRHYERGSEDFHRLLRILGAFITEGSSSIRSVTTETRDMFSLCQDDESWLLRLRDDLQAITRGVTFTGPTWSEGSKVYYLRSGAGMLPCLFGLLGGIQGSKARKLPSFVYALSGEDFKVFWTLMVEGDGTVSDVGATAYTTIAATGCRVVVPVESAWSLPLDTLPTLQGELHA